MKAASSLWRAPGRLTRALGRLRHRITSLRWPPHSRLHLVSDNAPWALTEEMRALGILAQRLGIPTLPGHLVRCSRDQTAFFASMDLLLSHRAWEGGNRVGVAYFHGRPGIGNDVFDRRFEGLCNIHEHVERLQVTNSEFRDVVLQSGIAPEKVFLIPIGITLSQFPIPTPESKRAARENLGLPSGAVIVGSFQKDGVGWGEGLAPKPEKGPDVFVETMGLLRSRIPDLMVLLSGPARGYVKEGLRRLGVPFAHTQLESHAGMGELYQALDLYLVTSRDEGGPKAILESMASGVPLVTTRVGQVIGLVTHGSNAWMVDVDDVEGLAKWAEHALSLRQASGSGLAEVLARARRTAEANAYEKQLPLWQELFRGFVELGDE